MDKQKLHQDLEQAISRDDVDTVKKLIKEGADVNIVFGDNMFRYLHMAAMSGQTEVVRELIKSGADINATDTNGFTPFHCFMIFADDGRLDYYDETKRQMPNVIDVGRLLIRSGADVNVKNALGLTVLHFAAKYGNVDMVKDLIGAGADTTIKDINGHTPLDWTTSTAVADILRQVSNTCKYRG
jgi:ankyrin repeat protein